MAVKHYRCTKCSKSVTSWTFKPISKCYKGGMCDFQRTH